MALSPRVRILTTGVGALFLLSALVLRPTHGYLVFAVLLLVGSTLAVTGSSFRKQGLVGVLLLALVAPGLLARDKSASASFDYAAAAAEHLPGVDVQVARKLLQATVEGGSASGMRVIRELTSDGDLIGGREAQHVYAHAVGIIAQQTHTDSKTTYKDCAGDTTLGCYHGVATAAMEKLPARTTAEVARLCDFAYASGSDYASACWHSLPHVLLERNGPDMTINLPYCTVIETPSGRSECEGGVILMAVRSYHSDTSAGKTSDLFRKSTPLYPCSQLVEAVQGECYRLLPLVWFSMYDLDVTRFDELCRSAPVERQGACAFGIGALLGSNSPPKEARAKCPKGDLLDRCSLGTLTNLAIPSGDVAEVCSKLGGAEVRQACWGKVGERFLLEYPSSTEARKQNCERLPNADAIEPCKRSAKV